MNGLEEGQGRSWFQLHIQGRYHSTWCQELFWSVNGTVRFKIEMRIDGSTKHASVLEHKF